MSGDVVGPAAQVARDNVTNQLPVVLAELHQKSGASRRKAAAGNPENRSVKNRNAPKLQPGRTVCVECIICL